MSAYIPELLSATVNEPQITAIIVLGKKMDLMQALKIAALKLGYDSLKSEQECVIKVFATGHDVFAALSTGYGKGSCFAILPILSDLLCGHTEPTAMVLCISPLVSLMADQKAKFTPRGLVTEFVGSCWSHCGVFFSVCSFPTAFHGHCTVTVACLLALTVLVNHVHTCIFISALLKFQ